MSRHPPGIPPIISLTAASALWGVATVISKELLATVPPILFLIIQLGSSVVLLWLLVLVRGFGQLQGRGWLPLTLLGVLNPGFSYTLSMLGLARTSASVATLLWAAEPALIVGLAWLVLREPLKLRLVAATAAAAGGVLLVSGLALGAAAASDLSGNILILGGVLCCALYTVLSRRIVAGADLLFTVALQEAAGLAWAVALWSLGLHGFAGRSFSALSRAEWIGGALSGVMYYAAAFWFYLAGLRAVPVAVAGGFLNLIPVFGIATAYVLLAERLTPAQWTGTGVILLSVLALLKWREQAI